MSPCWVSKILPNWMTCWPTCSSIARTVLWTRHKNWCFWTVVLQKTLESPLDCKEIQPVHPKGNQSWISLEGLMLKLKLQYFGHLMQRADSFEKPWCWERLKAEGEGDDRGWDGWMASLTWWTWVWVGSRSWQWTGKLGELQSMRSQEVDTTEQLNWLNCEYTHTHTHTHPPHNDEIKFIFYGRTRINNTQNFLSMFVSAFSLPTLQINRRSSRMGVSAQPWRSSPGPLPFFWC